MRLTEKGWPGKLVSEGRQVGSNLRAGQVITKEVGWKALWCAVCFMTMRGIKRCPRWWWTSEMTLPEWSCKTGAKSGMQKRRSTAGSQWKRDSGRRWICPDVIWEFPRSDNRTVWKKIMMVVEHAVCRWWWWMRYLRCRWTYFVNAWCHSGAIQRKLRADVPKIKSREVKSSILLASTKWWWKVVGMGTCYMIISSPAYIPVPVPAL